MHKNNDLELLIHDQRYAHTSKSIPGFEDSWETIGTSQKRRSPRVTLFLRSWQLFPEIITRGISSWYNAILLILLWCSWLVSNIIIANNGIMAVSTELGKISKSTLSEYSNVPTLSCGRNDDLCIGSGYNCGGDSQLLTDTLVGTHLVFKCPANCGSESWTYEAWPVGTEQLIRTPVVVGGPDIYRGDSFICASALHAGIISRYTGGCGKLEWIGPHTGFESFSSKDGKFNSTSFDSDFPINFRFVNNDNLKVTKCRDLRGIHIIVNVFFIIIAAYLIPTNNCCVYYLATLSIFGFWTVTLASHPPLKGGSPELNAELISQGFERMLPCILGLFYVYTFAAKPQLEGMRASLSRAIFWGGGYTMGILENYVFGFIPIDRLILSDLKSQPGAWFALILVAITLLIIILGQAYGYWVMGELKKYLKGYSLALVVLLTLSFWPGETLRLHHYIFALLLLPGTSLRTTCSLYYQGLLVGLYIAGIARWGFDSILQTTEQLSRGGPLPSLGQAVQFLEPLTNDSSSFILRWQQMNFKGVKNGYSLMINDIEINRQLIEEINNKLGVLNSTMVTHTFNLTAWALRTYAERRPSGKWYIRVASFQLHNKLPYFNPYSEALVINADGSYHIG